MDYRKIIKEVGRGKNHARDTDVDTARALYLRMLDGEVAELELGGILIALRIKGEGEAEMQGFYEAMQQKTLRLTPPVARPMPIVIPSYNGARKQANLTPLLAVLLHKLGFPVVVHGISHDPTRVLTETIFELMGIPATRHAASSGATRRPRAGVHTGWRTLPAAGETACPALAYGRTQQRAYAGKAGDAICGRCGATFIERFSPRICGQGGEILC